MADRTGSRFRAIECDVAARVHRYALRGQSEELNFREDQSRHALSAEGLHPPSNALIRCTAAVTCRPRICPACRRSAPVRPCPTSEWRPWHLQIVGNTANYPGLQRDTGTELSVFVSPMRFGSGSRQKLP